MPRPAPDHAGIEAGMTDDASAPLLRATDVSLRLEGTPILTSVDVDLRAGELVALVGPNGAGKSTLLGILAGDTTPDTGSVRLGGRPLDSFHPREAARHRAVQTQENRLAFAFTTADVVRMGRAPWSRTAAARRDDEVVAAALDLTEMTALAERRLPTLSGGEKARAAFSRVVAQETAVLLLDEPTAALDIRHQEAVLQAARERCAAGVGVVVVLHDLSLAAAYADRVVLLEAGRVRADGPPDQVLTADLLSAVYRYPVDVLRTDLGDLVVVPARRAHRTSASPSGHPDPHTPTAPTPSAPLPLGGAR